MDAKSSAFPAKIWVKIFDDLSAFQLTQARLVCRAWYDIVCGEPSLIGKFTIARVEDFADDEEWQDVNKPAALNAMRRYVRVCLFNAINIPLDTSWLALGQNLKVLSLDVCCIGTDTMVEMLRRAPQLESLRMNDRFCFRDKCQAAINFKLEKMETLDLCVENLGEALRVFEQICPPLKTLKISLFFYRADEALIRFIQSMLATLREFQLRDVYPEDGLLQRILNLDWQTLSTVSFGFKWKKDPCCNFDLHNLKYKVERAILSPITIWNDESLDKFRSFLPFLQCITLETTLPDDSFVKILPSSLRSLSIAFADVYKPPLRLDLSGYHNPNLTNLKLSRVLLPRESFLQCCQHCPNINSLSLSQCTFADPAEMSTAIAQLRSLAELELLAMCKYLYVECPTPWTVTELALYSCSVREEAIAKMLRQCPQLTSISFDRCTMTGSTVVAMWQQFGPQLRSVKLHDCRSLGSEFVDCFLEQRCQLERLTVWNCRLDFAAKLRLRSGLRGVHLKLK